MYKLLLPKINVLSSTYELLFVRTTVVFIFEAFWFSLDPFFSARLAIRLLSDLALVWQGYEVQNNKEHIKIKTQTFNHYFKNIFISFH